MVAKVSSCRILEAPGFYLAWDPFLESPERFSHPEIKAAAKSQTPGLQSCFVPHILHMNRSFLHITSFRSIHPSFLESD